MFINLHGNFFYYTNDDETAEYRWYQSISFLWPSGGFRYGYGETFSKFPVNALIYEDGYDDVY